MKEDVIKKIECQKCGWVDAYSEMILVPDKCLICDAEWSGGNQKPNEQMKNLSFAYYNCGAKIICEKLHNGYKLLIINCENSGELLNGE